MFVTKTAPLLAEPVPFWRTKLGEEEVAAASDAVRNGLLSMGPRSRDLEEKLARFLGVPHILLTTSGSVALYLAFASLGIGPGDEVIVPNRTFIATAHAVLMTGAKVRLVDSRANSTLIDEALIEQAITPRTKAIAPVHLNGNAVDMKAISAIAKAHHLFVVEDAAQAFGSQSEGRFLGTFGDIGCWSLGVTKLITTGQGGFVCTHNADLYDKLVRLRTHGVLDTFAANYQSFGLNFRSNDIAASIGLVQMTKVAAKIQRHIEVYRWYEQALSEIPFMRMIPVDIEYGGVPLWVEVLCSQRDRVVHLLGEQQIQTRPFLPDLSQSPHLENNDADFKNSKRFAAHGMWLPVGPDLPQSAMERTIAALRALKPLIRPLET